MTTQAVSPGASLPIGVPNPKGRFGTFAGVFTPNVLTILGLILFLRTGWVVGQAGLVGALVIVLVANVITLLTGLSLSAIATSMNVRTGGNYYLISRSLGLEIGGAIGIPLYLSQAISVAFYIIGFTEALLSVPFFQTFDPRLISTVVVLAFGLIAYIGADFALRIQFVVLAALVAAILSFFAGGWGDFTSPTLSASFTENVGFWAVFAVFFPAVTGITVGASMSGDLKDPGKSIPLGTLLSIGVTAVVYILSVIWLSLHATPDDLIANNLIMQQIARIPVLILVGVWAATLSSALGSVVAAPRVLQALANDRVVPGWMAGQMGSPTEPRVAVLATTVIAASVIWLGDLDFVAPIITMFFLNTYGVTNLGAAVEQIVGNPSYRPRFKIHWSLSLLGALGCYGAMFLINAVATTLAIIATVVLYAYLERRSLAHTWGDVRSGIWFALARFALLKLETQRVHVKNWRPNIIVFTGQPHNREPLVQVAEWLSQGRGIVTFFQLLVGDVGRLTESGLRESARRRIRDYIQGRQMTAFAEADVVPDFHSGALTVAQAHGVGGIEPNSVLLGWSDSEAGQVSQLRLMRDLHWLGKSLLILKHDEKHGFGERRRIDVWWGGGGDNADLMLLLAYIVSSHRAWGQAQVRLLRVIESEVGREQTRAHMQQELDRVRVDAELVVLVRENPAQSISDIICQQSVDTDFTLLGMQIPTSGEEAVYGQSLAALAESVGSVLLVRSAQKEDLLEVD